MHKNKRLIIFAAFILSFFNFENGLADALIGEISQEEFKVKRPVIIDAITKEPVQGAKISIPIENKVDYTDKDGHFKISPSKNSPVILSVQKDGYRPFSLTLADGKMNSVTVLELEKKNPLNIIVNDTLLHLGDNSYSENSSGACMINAPCIGPSFTKKFYIKELTSKTKIFVTIGSVIGIDTVQAMKLGQNSLKSATSSPVGIFVNNVKIGELKVNGDNQKVPVPIKILKQNSDNILTLKTGVNLTDTTVTDYDDIELMNVIVDIIK